jgi:hypothetical protein
MSPITMLRQRISTPAAARRGWRAIRDHRQRGQIIVIAAMTMITLIGGVSLILEGGNAYAHQRVAQNAADSTANAGAMVIGQRLGGGNQTDADVFTAIDQMADANGLDTYIGYYTDVKGHLLTPLGLTTTNVAAAERVGDADGGDTTIPPGAQGVRVGGSQSFGTTFARVLGITQFTASADATAVAGGLSGGVFMPVVFPVSLASCDGSGSTVVTDEPWRLANPDPNNANGHPIGQEYIVPLCKTHSGAFMLLDLDPNKNCEEEVTNPSSIQFDDFPVYVTIDEGNDCAKKVSDAINTANLQGQVVMIPICDGQCVTINNGADCPPTSPGVGHKCYHIIRIAAFYLDYLSDSNNKNNSACDAGTSPTYGTSMVNITGGNGSSSCMVGWFVRYVTSGPVGTGQIHNGEAIGVQLIR